MLSRWPGVKSKAVHRHRLISLSLSHLEPYLWLSDMNVFGTSVCHLYVHRRSLNTPSSKRMLEINAGPICDQSNRRIEPIFTSPPSFFPVVALAADSFRPWGATTRSGSNQFDSSCPSFIPAHFPSPRLPLVRQTDTRFVRTNPAVFPDALKEIGE